MKKTLIALAAVAVSGAAMAQVTISGKYAFGFKSDTVSNVATSGMETTDGDIVISASEDLGGGMKISAVMATEIRGNGATQLGRDAYINLSTGTMGSFLMGRVESAEPINGYFATGRGLDGTVSPAAKDVDALIYTLPTFVSGVTLRISKSDQVSTGAVNALNTTRYQADYAAGPLKVAYDVTNYKAASTIDSRTLIGGSYDLGMVKISAARSTVKAVLASTQDEKYTAIGFDAPVTANMTVGITRVTAKQGTTMDKSGTALGLNYALSKRTAVQLTHQTAKQSATAVKDTYNRVRLTHSF